jgi:predicted ATPase/transcriptional regulator with XRE-family HTH domain
MMSFGTWVHRRRRALDLTQKELAELVGVSAGMIVQIEGDKRQPSRLAAERLAQALQLSEDAYQEFVRAARGERTVDFLPAPSQEAVVSAEPKRTDFVSNLPVPATPWIGRETEMAEVTHLLKDPQCRLLTLFGQGGIGKTRLALQIGRSLLESADGKYLHGVHFVPLAPLSSREFMVPAIASALRLVFRSEQAFQLSHMWQKEQLLDYLRDKKLMLLMDNFEHLTDGSGLLSEILAYASDVRILVTSRERLNLSEEWVYEVRGMTYPRDGSPDHLEEYNAAQLFLQNARQASGSFSLSDDDRPCVANICQLLEGVPLAIEMAAAWLRMFSCAEITRRIEENADFLTTSRRGVPERHQSLRAVFEHSWNLLNPDEQQLYQSLSVFRGAFRLSSAEKVLAGQVLSSDQINRSTSSINMLSLLTALVDKSLLRRVMAEPDTPHPGEGRYEMHELLKQYAVEKLAQNPAMAEQAQKRHAMYYLDLLARMIDEIRSPGQLHALSHIQTEIDDIRLAWRWGVEHGHVSEIRRAAGTLFQFYNIRSRFQEGEEDFRIAVKGLRRLVDSPSEAKNQHPFVDATLAFMLFWWGYYRAGLGEINEALQLYQESLDLADQLNDKQRAYLYMFLIFEHSQPTARLAVDHYDEVLGVLEQSGDIWGVAFLHLSYAQYSQYAVADIPRARQFYQQALKGFRQVGDRWGMVLCYNNLGYLAYSLGEYEQVKLLSLESLALCQALGDRWQVAESLSNLGQADAALGNYARAKETYETGLALMRELGNQRSIASHLACIGYVDYLTGNQSQAEQAFTEALNLSLQINDRREVGIEQINLGNVACARNDFQAARRYYLEAVDCLETVGERWGMAVALKRLGKLCFNLGEISQSWEYYRQALRISIQIQRKPEVLENLVGMAELLGLEGGFDRTVEILSLCLSQSELTQVVRQSAESQLEAVRLEMLPKAYASAFASGTLKKIEESVEEILVDESIG